MSTGKRKAPGQHICPTCGRRLPSHPSSRLGRDSWGWDPAELAQLVGEMEISEISSLLGISRWELEKRCQSLGIDLRGSEKEEA